MSNASSPDPNTACGAENPKKVPQRERLADWKPLGSVRDHFAEQLKQDNDLFRR